VAGPPQGEWDGAPPGSQGKPPGGDGRFDRKDIVAALQAGKYLTGPFAAFPPAEVCANVFCPVPQPDTLVLLIVGGAVFLAYRGHRKRYQNGFQKCENRPLNRKEAHDVGQSSRIDTTVTTLTDVSLGRPIFSSERIGDRANRFSLDSAVYTTQARG
jgi:hypothetical protein